ncbi:MAG: hypothetical protein V4515_14065 [Chloroflexota bacterium]
MFECSIPSGVRRLGSVLGVTIAVTVAACATGSGAAPSASVTARSTSAATSSPAAATGSGSSSPSSSTAPDTGGGTTSGDIPDNAVFLTYRPASPTFSIEYVEGWQVTPQGDGVVIRDKDSSETVALVARTADATNYVSTVDLPLLRTEAGFQLVSQDSVAVNGASYVHLVFHIPAPPDPVTGKRVPSTVDRYYVQGPNGLAIVSLSTPDGVDNVDAFRQMIQSFKWL